MNSSIWALNGTITWTTTQGQSEPWSNGNEGPLHITPNSRTGVSSSDGLVGWFYGISAFVGYLMPNPFLYK